MRVWMEPHDRLSFKIVWVEIIRLVGSLTTRRLTFKNLHHGGRILGINSDMEAAPLLGFAEAVWETLTPERQAEVETPRQLLSYVLRVCYVHFERYVRAFSQPFPTLTLLAVSTPIISVSSRPRIAHISNRSWTARPLLHITNGHSKCSKFPTLSGDLAVCAAGTISVLSSSYTSSVVPKQGHAHTPSPRSGTASLADFCGQLASVAAKHQLWRGTTSLEQPTNWCQYDRYRVHGKVMVNSVLHTLPIDAP